jgi:hypothetical protein
VATLLTLGDKNGAGICACSQVHSMRHSLNRWLRAAPHSHSHAAMTTHWGEVSPHLNGINFDIPMHRCPGLRDQHYPSTQHLLKQLFSYTGTP